VSGTDRQYDDEKPDTNAGLIAKYILRIGNADSTPASACTVCSQSYTGTEIQIECCRHGSRLLAVAAGFVADVAHELRRRSDLQLTELPECLQDSVTRFEAGDRRQLTLRLV
jgi:hypothetical protein